MELVPTVRQDPHEDLGFVSGFALTDRVLLAAGGVERTASLVASSDARHFEPRRAPGALFFRLLSSLFCQILRLQCFRLDCLQLPSCSR